MTEPKATTPDNSPLVTAVLVCWNHEQFVKASVLSALKQTYQNIQLLVFDNDSSDGSWKIIERLTQEYRFQFIRQPNIGLTKTLNKALELAEGKYFTMLATDDIWLLDKIERQVAYMEHNPAVTLLCGNTVAIDDKDQVIALPPNNRPAHEVTFQELMEQGNCVHGPTVFIRTQCLRERGGYDTSMQVEDYPMALQLTQAGKKIFHSGELYTLYRRHGGNWTNRPFYKEHLEIGRPYRHFPEYRGYLRNHMQGYFRMLAGENKEEAIYFLRTQPLVLSYREILIGLAKLALPVTLIRYFRNLSN